MRILAIRGKNLASLEGEFTIDFTAEPLKSAGIFAITGSTGSGKSTLLDALCLALFDETPRSNKASENIKIQDVKDKFISQKDSRNILRRGASDAYAEVDFVSLGGDIFRSRWSLRRSRDKADGSLQNSELRLTKIATNVEVQGRKTELLAKIVELIGLSFDQFTRAVLLAQGDFATFLKASQKEKAELLEKLTGTDIYSRISTSIFEKSKNAELELKLIKERIKDIELLSEDDVEALEIEKQAVVQEIESLKNELTILLAKIKWIADEEALSKNIKQAEQVLSKAQTAIEEAKPRYHYISQIDSVQEIRDNFAELKNVYKQLEENKTNLATQVAGRDANSILLKQAVANFTDSETQQKEAGEAFAKIEPQIKQARDLDTRIIGAETNDNEAQKEHNQALEAKDKVVKSIENAQKSLDLAAETIVGINAWFDQNKQYQEIVPRIDLILNLLEDAYAANEQAEVNGKTLAQSKAISDSDAIKLTELTKEAEHLNTLLPAEIAELRAKLKDGVPCAVCGSIHHTVSSTIKDESLEEKELNNAKKDVANRIAILSQHVETRKDENIRLQSALEAYAKQYKKAMSKLGDYLAPVPSWQEMFEKDVLHNILKDIAQTWNKHTETQNTIKEKVASIKTRIESEQQSLAEADKMLSAKEQKKSRTTSELETLQKERALLLEGKNADEIEKIYADKREKLRDNLEKLTKSRSSFSAIGDKYSGVIAQIEEEISKLSKHYAALYKNVDAWILSKNGTITMAQLSDLFSKNSAWLMAERNLLNSLHQNKTTAVATLSERNKHLENHCKVQVKPLENETKESLQAIFTERSGHIEQKTTRNTEIDMLFANHNKGKERIKLFEKKIDEKNSLSDNWKKLSDMFGSADGSKFKVLAQGYTLEVLLRYANKHLKELSRRYELQRIPDTLALQVIDLDMLGEIRSVHSLSGGESFLISLALALGLSSLSSKRMKVESLFIDEGFGSLDIDTLRVAMDALERLQTQGRKIGVISHVAEMTERIATQIRVVKTVNGRSSVEVVSL
ncbi:exonuclease [Bacteroidales bacterium]|nr:exonuclease [Bacteroidales bacterium]